MGKWLTFIDNKGFAASGTYPDENFAREIMELFSIGLHNLDEYGTTIKDEVGNAMPSYDNHDIMSFARAWTGFRRSPMRSNIEQRMGIANYVDPMQIKAKWRDANPKVDLEDGYFGDKRPLCVDIPEKAFLRTGATYVYRGHVMPKSPDRPVGQWWNTNDPNDIGFTKAETTSPLYQTLCSADTNGACTWPTEVTLTAKHECDGAECLVDTVRAIQVTWTAPWGSETIYYEYKPVECVRLAFYDDAKMIKTGGNHGKIMCADPRLAMAASVCCASATSTEQGASARCQYAREYVTFATGVSRCEIQTNSYTNQYEPDTGPVTDHYVSHGQNIFWHIYPQLPPDCMMGCGSDPSCQNDEGGPSEECAGNSNYVSSCRSPHETFNVHCCSDNPIPAQPGDWENQTYSLATDGACASYTYPGSMMDYDNYTDGKPYVNGVITNFASAAEHCGANPTCLNTDGTGSEETNAGGTAACVGIATNTTTTPNCAAAFGQSVNPTEIDCPPGCTFSAANSEEITDNANTDTDLNDCSWYALDQNAAQCGNFDHVGFYANSMCCACGGGVAAEGFDATVGAGTCDGCVHAKTYDEAVAACEADGARLCTRWEAEANCNHQAGCDGDNSFVWTSTECVAQPEFMCDAFSNVDGPGYCHSQNEWSWTNKACLLQLQVDVSGYIMLVHGGDLRSNEDIYSGYEQDNMNVFRVPWADADDATVGGPGNYPHSGDSCANSGCEKVGFTCLCTPDVTQTAVFDSTTAPSYAEVRAQLKYGAPNPNIFDEGTYALHPSSTADVDVWQPTANAGSYDMETIFMIEYPAGTNLYLSNIDSQVTMGAFSFRNPSTHISSSQPTHWDAEYETDAVVEHIAQHANAPVFIARLLILRMTTSNPSPRYIKVVGDAYRTGTHGGVTYSGKHGCLTS